MTHSFEVFIDEAGDDGFKNLKNIGGSGQTHWLVLGCCIVSKSNSALMPSWRDEIVKSFPFKKSRDLHFHKLSHEQKVQACNILALKPARFGVVLSNKKTILTHPRQDLFEAKNSLYWYLCRFLIERISAFCWRKRNTVQGDGTVRIVFSRRGGMDYKDFQQYMHTIKAKNIPVNSLGSIKWDVIDIDSIKAIDARNMAGLQLADVVTSAFYKAVEPDMYANFETRYAKILNERVLRSPDGYCLNHGVKPVPKLSEIPFMDGQKEIFDFYERKMKADP